MSETYLSNLTKGQKSVVKSFNLTRANNADQARDLEERLLEMGFEEGLEIEVLHEGPISRDPMAVRLGRIIIALRRNEADIIEVATVE